MIETHMISSKHTYDIIKTSKAYHSTKHIHNHRQGEPICMFK